MWGGVDGDRGRVQGPTKVASFFKDLIAHPIQGPRGRKRRRRRLALFDYIGRRPPRLTAQLGKAEGYQASTSQVQFALEAGATLLICSTDRATASCTAPVPWAQRVNSARRASRPALGEVHCRRAALAAAGFMVSCRVVLSGPGAGRLPGKSAGARVTPPTSSPGGVACSCLTFAHREEPHKTRTRTHSAIALAPQLCLTPPCRSQAATNIADEGQRHTTVPRPRRTRAHAGCPMARLVFPQPPDADDYDGERRWARSACHDRGATSTWSR